MARGAVPAQGLTQRLRQRVAAVCLRPWQNFRPLIHMTGADFDAITHDKALCDADGAIDAAGFEIMMREQVRTRTAMRARCGGNALRPRSILAR